MAERIDSLVGLVLAIIGVFVAVVAVSFVVFMIVATLADAHMRDRPELDAWFSGLHSKKGLCCSFIDGSSLSDVDWDVNHEGRECIILPTDEQTPQTGHYCVRLEGQWWLVPDNAVIDDPNRFGPAVVWPIYVSTMGAKNKLIGIRCFLKGAET